MSDRTQDLTNHRKVAITCKNYTDNKITELKWELGSHTLDVTTDSDTKYIKNVPSGAIGCQINQIGGMSYKCLNLVNTALFELGSINTTNGSNDDRNDRTRSNYIEVKPNTQYTVKWDGENVNYFLYDENKVFIHRSVGGTITTTAATKYIRFYSGLITENTQVMLNEGSVALPYQPYFEGIRNSAVTSVVSKGANLLQLNDVAETTTNGITYKAENGVITLNGTTSAETSISLSISLSLSGTYTLSAFNTFTIANSLFLITTEGNKSVFLNATNKSTSFNFSSATASQLIIWIPSSTVFSNDMFSPMLVSGSTVPSEYKAYRGTIDTLTIPTAIQNLTGYGQSNPDDQTQYNYIDFVNKTFVRVGYIDNDTWVTSALVTDISAYLTTDTIDVEGGGSLEFTNTYSQDVPSDIDYLIEEVKA